MRYIKTYEELKYVGDISIDDPSLIKNNEDLPKDAKFKIGEDVAFKVAVKDGKFISPFLYKIKYYYKKNNINYCYIMTYPDENFSRTWKLEDNLISEEEWNMYNQTEKYNL